MKGAASENALTVKILILGEYIVLDKIDFLLWCFKEVDWMVTLCLFAKRIECHQAKTITQWNDGYKVAHSSNCTKDIKLSR